MKLTEYEDLNKFLTVLDSCQADVLVEIETTLSNSEINVVDFISAIHQFELTHTNKSSVIDSIAENFKSDFCYHFRIYKDGQLVGQSFDHCVIMDLNPDYFVFNETQLAIMTDSEINFSPNIKS